MNNEHVWTRQHPTLRVCTCVAYIWVYQHPANQLSFLIIRQKKHIK